MYRIQPITGATHNPGVRPSWERRGPPSVGRLGQRSVLAFVLERQLKLGAAGDRSALVQVNLVLGDLSRSKIADGPG